jgi:TPP-dependent pyruvate/acetoin dehydrogenase alpha subunit
MPNQEELMRELKRAVHRCTVDGADRWACFQPIMDALAEYPSLAPSVVELVLVRYCTHWLRLGSTL